MDKAKEPGEGFIDKLRSAYEDETSDVEKYMKMSAEAGDHFPKTGYAAILRDIAKEEKIHRMHIRSILCDMGAWEEGAAEEAQSGQNGSN